ncbi:MAG: hypothetical protein RL562_1260, partial [Planctomycetota bacterium]
GRATRVVWKGVGTPGQPPVQAFPDQSAIV